MTSITAIRAIHNVADPKKLHQDRLTRYDVLDRRRATHGLSRAKYREWDNLHMLLTIKELQLLRETMVRFGMMEPRQAYHENTGKIEFFLLRRWLDPDAD